VLKIVTTSLPNGQVSHAYSATLAATGGTAPLSWALSSGALPAGLALTASTGAISGTPTASTAGTQLTFTVTDSGVPAQSKNINLSLTVNPANITVSVSPGRAALTVGQLQTLTATTDDYSGVTWSASPAGGSFSSTTSQSGSAIAFTAPASAGVYTVTATSVTDASQNASITVAVTDLPGVFTYHNDLARDGANTSEYALTPANVNTTAFGKLFSCTVDGAVYAQPLWVANLGIGGGVHNVVFVATAHDSLYAFDADASPCVQLWQVSLIDSSHGGSGGEVTVPDSTYANQYYGSVSPEIGVIGTPVIDPLSMTLYVVSKSMSSATPASFYQRLHAIDITTGNERSGSPVSIDATTTYPGTGDGGPSVAFNVKQENQRAGLAMVNGTVYIAWAAHEDLMPWYGWMLGYSGASLTRSSALNVTPNSLQGGIWMSGAAPSADAAGNLYVITGNGAFDVTNASGPTNDYGDSFLQLSPGLTVSSWFAPSDQATDNTGDVDFGSGGAAVVLDLSTGPLRRLVVGGGKDGTLYVLNGDSMGGLGDPNAWQYFSVGHGIFATAAFWNNTLYLTPVKSAVLAYEFDTGTYMFDATPTSQSPTTYGFPGATVTVSASGTSTNGVVWAIDSSSYCTHHGTTNAPCGPAVLHAYDATNLATELWNSSAVAADAAGYAVKFTVPTVANGRVYIGTRGNNTGGNYGSTSVSGELDVYGLKPQ
jgi:hypothetical protein